jgi:hypothetical protein
VPGDPQVGDPRTVVDELETRPGLELDQHPATDGGGGDRGERGGGLDQLGAGPGHQEDQEGAGRGEQHQRAQDREPEAVGVHREILVTT